MEWWHGPREKNGFPRKRLDGSIYAQGRAGVGKRNERPPRGRARIRDSLPRQSRQGTCQNDLRGEPQSGICLSEKQNRGPPTVRFPVKNSSPFPPLQDARQHGFGSCRVTRCPPPGCWPWQGRWTDSIAGRTRTPFPGQSVAVAKSGCSCRRHRHHVRRGGGFEVPVPLRILRLHKLPVVPEYHCRRVAHFQ